LLHLKKKEEVAQSATSSFLGTLSIYTCDPRKKITDPYTPVNLCNFLASLLVLLNIVERINLFDRVAIAQLLISLRALPSKQFRA
jgi:hypothetical protein